MIPDTTKRTEAALKRHVAAIMAGDADSAMRNFADDAVVYTAEGPLHGQDAIRADIESFINSTHEGMRDNF
jgi:ketosteroid isomerase-like protein